MEDGFPTIGARKSSQPEQSLSDSSNDRVELGVPRSGVVQHGLLDAQAGRERAGSEK